MRDSPMRGARTIIAWALASAALLLLSLPLRAEIPDEARRWERVVTRSVRVAHGLDGPVALHGALIHQESSWDAEAESPVGARGLAQLMPRTEEHVEELDPLLDEIDALDPRQAIRAAAQYTAWVHDYVTPSEAPWAMTLSGYNGGVGWVQRDRELAAEHGADPDRWWCNVAEYTERSEVAERENRHYVERIMLELQPRYLRAGWPGPEVVR
jgi:Predicted soluble lytic transglycosylase fused to an ABC-type amino acid-binding protein